MCGIEPQCALELGDRGRQMTASEQRFAKRMRRFRNAGSQCRSFAQRYKRSRTVARCKLRAAKFDACKNTAAAVCEPRFQCCDIFLVFQSSRECLPFCDRYYSLFMLTQKRGARGFF